jgi:hypothetical protein
MPKQFKYYPYFKLKKKSFFVDLKCKKIYFVIFYALKNIQIIKKIKIFRFTWWTMLFSLVHAFILHCPSLINKNSLLNSISPSFFTNIFKNAIQYTIYKKLITVTANSKIVVNYGIVNNIENSLRMEKSFSRLLLPHLAPSVRNYYCLKLLNVWLVKKHYSKRL